MFVTTQTPKYCSRAILNSTQKQLANTSPLDSSESYPVKQLPSGLDRQNNFKLHDSHTVTAFPIDESYIELAVSVYRSQNVSSLQALKDFLTVLANPISIEKVLLKAIYRLAENHPTACRWLLSDPGHLMPELDVIEFTTQLALFILKEKNINLDAIALLNQSPQQCSQQKQNELWQEIFSSALGLSSCPGDCLLLEASLNSTRK